MTIYTTQKIVLVVFGTERNLVQLQRLLGTPLGGVAGSLSKNGRWIVSTPHGNYLAHRVIWALVYGETPEDFVIDHINRISFHNHISNLRAVSVAQNSRNKNKSPNNSSGKTGVSVIGKGGNKVFVATALRNGKAISKRFRVDRYGEEEAFRLACEARDEMIYYLNLEGAGYTRYHGT